MRLRAFFVLLLLAAAAIPFSAQAATPEIYYIWKSGDLLRFDYLKSVTITQPDEQGNATERRTEMAAVLILEIKSSSPAGASGILRFDSPRISLPPIQTFTSQADAPELQADKNRAISKAMESAIKAARWNVNLTPDGAIQITGRTPANLADWLKETSSAGGWRRKAQDVLTRLVEQDLGLKTQSTDREIFACSSDAPATTNPGEALHPVRTQFSSTAKAQGKLNITFKRQFLAASNTEFTVPNLLSPLPVKITPQSIVSTEALAVFDSRSGMLDTLNEDYNAKMKYNCGSDSINQDVRVQYRLKRLAPAIRND